MNLVTRDSLQQMIDTASPDKLSHIVGRALVVLFNNQTEDEKSSNGTYHQNNKGFAGCDAKGGTLTAKYYLARKSLMNWQIEKWIRQGSNGYARICKYAGQLNEAAVAKKGV